ncbi:MAG: FHA domain-containing protein [Propioniciclava sp.]
MTTCPQCGESSGAGDNFCPNCGASLRGGSGDTTRVIPMQSPEESSVEVTQSHLDILDTVPEGSAVLLVVRGPNQGATFLLDRELVTAGRHPQSDIFLDDITVSRHHARISDRGGHRWLADENSLNGTYVNRALIDSEVALRPNDEVQIGKFRLVYLVAPSGSR